VRVWGFSRYVFAISAATAILANCAGSQPPIGAPGAIPEGSTQLGGHSFRVLYRFAGGRDGAGPGGPLIDVKGTLYSTTGSGGSHPKCGYGGGCGTVYSISTSGTEKVVYRFAGGSDGWLPVASLLDHNGTLYGTTRYGGGSGCVEYFGCGTIYTINVSGAEKVLYAFESNINGSQPLADVIDLKGTLYGTTYLGGASYGGTVFSLSKDGVETVLHSFSGGTDGEYPYAGLIDIKGTLYGTTWSGGTGCGASGGCGTVFSISTSGVEKVIYSFAGGSDGSFPNAGLTALDGVMYGTTSPFLCCSRGTGWGTVYRVSTRGEEKVLHRFGHGSDGAQPIAGLTNVKGTLYGTTKRGGSGSGCGKESGGYPGGCGTVFSITTAGTESVLHSFDGADGELPQADLTYVNGTLYGTAGAGGRPKCGGYHSGCGTVFALSP
jgi:uncharacterized repeat protein (TIGR03803 family)